ncbi:MAG: hypothetical protein Q8Q31_01625 [Nanoarchaeota archaeon]|nr:hypothetical protein [Nanoarchaeota archaeon]
MNRVKVPREGASSFKDAPSLLWVLSLALIFIIIGKFLASLIFLFWIGLFLFVVAGLYALLWFLSLFSS